MKQMKELKDLKITKNGNLNRSQLLKIAKLGNLEAKCNYQYTDDYDSDNKNNLNTTDWLPLQILEGHGTPPLEDGIIYLREDDFFEPGGAAYFTDKGTVALRIYQGCQYELRERF